MSDTAEKVSQVLDKVKPVLDKARKPGIATSEGLMALAALIVSIITTFCGVAKDAWWLVLAGKAGAVLVVFAYLAARTGLKKALAQLPDLLAKAMQERGE